MKKCACVLLHVERSDDFNGLPIMPVGHSWGGYAVSAVLNYDHNINAVVSFSGSEVFEEQGALIIGNVFYLDGEDIAGHVFVFYSKKQREYMNQTREDWEAYKANHGSASKLQWTREIKFDKNLANELNINLMDRINDLFNRVVQKLQFLNNNRLNKEEKHGFPQETHVFRKTCSITNRVIEQVQ